MPVKDNREYRYALPFEVVDDTDPADCIVEGYATTFDSAYDFTRNTKEVIRSSAFDGADMDDVIFQYDHSGLVMARQRNGSLTLNCDEHGLHVRASLKGSQSGRDLYEAIKNGLVDRMSWGFSVAPDGWEYDDVTRTSYVNKVEKVFDVSAVSIPANQGTEIHARSYLDGVIEREQQELLRREKEKAERAKIATFLEMIKE